MCAARARKPDITRESLADLIKASVGDRLGAAWVTDVDLEALNGVVKSRQRAEPIVSGLDRMAKAVASKPVVAKPAPKAATRPKAPPRTPTAEQLAAAQAELRKIDAWGRKMRADVAAERAVKAEIAKAKARAVDEKVLPGGRISRLISRTASKIIFEIRAA